MKYRPCFDFVAHGRTQDSVSVMSPFSSLWIVLQHMRNVAERRQQLEVEHKEALLVLQEKQEEVRRLQQVCSVGENGPFTPWFPGKWWDSCTLFSWEVQCMEEVYVSLQDKVNQGRLSAFRQTLVPEQSWRAFLPNGSSDLSLLFVQRCFQSVQRVKSIVVYQSDDDRVNLGRLLSYLLHFLFLLRHRQRQKENMKEQYSF